MGKLIGLIIIIVVGIFVYMHFSQPPNPADVRAKAQSTAYDVVNYWLESAKNKQLSDMQAVSDENAVEDAKRVLDEIAEIENKKNAIYDNFAIFTMGTPNAYRAVLSAKGDGIIMQLTVLTKEKDGKFWVVDVTIE